ncbi:hypothetical protein EDB19DRAFT_1912726 [Suillus lakei]|nr:hypothetical protein EDB19DRAFT_1912726 [Suillus lakei]
MALSISKKPSKAQSLAHNALLAVPGTSTISPRSTRLRSVIPFPSMSPADDVASVMDVNIFDGTTLWWTAF